MSVNLLVFLNIYRYRGYLAQGCRVEGLGSGSTLGKWKRTTAHEPYSKLLEGGLSYIGDDYRGGLKGDTRSLD